MWLVTAGLSRGHFLPGQPFGPVDCINSVSTIHEDRRRLVYNSMNGSSYK